MLLEGEALESAKRGIDETLRAESEARDRLVSDRMSRAAFDSLPEYSVTLPTGVRRGKVWKRNVVDGLFGMRVHLLQKELREHVASKPALWVVCEYVATPDPNVCAVEMRRPEIIE